MRQPLSVFLAALLLGVGATTAYADNDDDADYGGHEIVVLVTEYNRAAILGPLCGLRTLEWGDSLNQRLIAWLDGNADLTSEQHHNLRFLLAAATLDATRDFRRDKAQTCQDVADDLPDADSFLSGQ